MARRVRGAILVLHDFWETFSVTGMQDFREEKPILSLQNIVRGQILNGITGFEPASAAPEAAALTG